MEQHQVISQAHPAYSRRFGSQSIFRRVRRAVILVLYLPMLIVGRWILSAAHIHGEARSISVSRNNIALPQLPASFQGLTIAFLTDFHCSPETPPDFLERVVDETNRLTPDVILLGGDYVTRGTTYVPAVGNLLARLHAPMGVYGVLGNHDFDGNTHAIRDMLRRAGIVELTNAGHWLMREGSRILVAGVGDLWEDSQDLAAALAGAHANDIVILLSHNPDYAMQLTDPRVRLVLSGHTHGGQIRLPYVGTVISNSRYGRRLVSGLVPFDSFLLYISRGLGTVMMPFRYHCPPEITLLTLRAATQADCKDGNILQDKHT